MEDNYISDKEIKQKMDIVSPLEGGIVFGKDEAWDKLQNRLDARNARNIPAFYWAAAVLLVAICTGVFKYYRLETNAVAQQPQLNTRKLPGLEPHNPVIKQDGQPVQPDLPLAKIDVREAEGRTKTHPGSEQLSDLPDNTIPEDSVLAANPIIVEEPNYELAAKLDYEKTRSSTSAALSRMKVIHINELEKQYDSANAIDKQSDRIAVKISFRQMPVVHINDVIKEETAGDFMQMKNRSPLNLFTFIRPRPYELTLFGPATPSTPFSIKLKSN